MSALFRQNFLAVCACLAFSVGPGPRVFAAETNSLETSISPAVDTATQSMVNGYLQVQEQLHATRLAIESNRQEVAAALQSNAEDMAARIRFLEKIISEQRAGEIEATRKMQQLTLLLAGTFGAVGLAAMLLMVYLQWRAVTRLVELSAFPSSRPALGGGRALPLVEMGGELPAPGRAAVELSNARLLGVIERLEKHILELERTVRIPLGETASPAIHESNEAPPTADAPEAAAREQGVADLLAEGQSLLNANEPGKALECFDQALALHPQHAGTLVKKGGALEKLNRLDEALACYDRAIAADSLLTIAYLHKGGLFNRMARYDEALQCYEQALRTQEKKTPDGKVPAPA
jgi:tetratricopeptide (TPR) repeat protein